MQKKSKITSGLSETAQRALKEATIRNSLKNINDLPRELGGRDGPEPTRFGDWEKKGIATDF